MSSELQGTVNEAAELRGEISVGDTDVLVAIANYIKGLDLPNTYDAKGSADEVKTLLEQYKTSNDSKVDRNALAITGMKDGESIDSFKDVENALTKKQPTGNYATKEEAKGYADAKDAAIAEAKQIGTDNSDSIDKLTSDLADYEGITDSVIYNGSWVGTNRANVIPDVKIEDSTKWLGENASISFIDGEPSNKVSFSRVLADSSAKLCTIIPYTSFENGKSYRIAFDCGSDVGAMNVALRETKGILGQNRNRYQLADAQCNVNGTYRYVDFTFDESKHSDGYDWLELQIINSTSNEYVISEIFVGTGENTDYVVEKHLFFNENDSYKLRHLDFNKDAVVSNFDSVSEWKAVNLTTAIDVENFLYGKGTLFVTCDANTNGVLQMVKNLDFRDKILTISTFCSDVSNITQCTIMLSINDSTFNKTAYFPITPTLRSQEDGTWLKHTITPNDWKFDDGVTFNDLSNVKKIRISIRTSSSGSATIGFEHLAIYTKQYSDGYVSFLFDDGRKNVFLNAMPAFDKYNYSATTYVITDFVGTTQNGADFMTLNQLRILRDKGWTIGSHTTGHVHLSSLTGEALELALKDSHDWLVNNGFSEGSTHLAYPFGEFNAEVKEVARKYYDVAFTTKERWFADYAIDKMEIPRFSVINSNYSVQQAKNMILKAKENKQLLIIYLHNIGSEGIGSSTPDWSVEEFEQIVDYCNAININVINASDIKQMYALNRDNY